MTITDRPSTTASTSTRCSPPAMRSAPAPEAADFTWRATCTWKRGTYSRSTIDGFSGLGKDHVHRTTFDFDVDHPEVFASEDRGATPVENVLVGLVGCLTAGVAAVAQNRGIQLHAVTATIRAT